MMQDGRAIPLNKIKLEAVDRSIVVNGAVDSSTAANSAAEKMNRMQLRAYAGTYTLMSQFDLKIRRRQQTTGASHGTERVRN